MHSLYEEYVGLCIFLCKRLRFSNFSMFKYLIILYRRYSDSIKSIENLQFILIKYILLFYIRENKYYKIDVYFQTYQFIYINLDIFFI
jgi:hypothetical protein